jgi:serine/threonine-protein kinase
MTASLTPLAAALQDRYRIERELGAGGMATVYLALDLRHERKVAIKVLRPELSAVIGAERFVREIRTIAALQHPHILGLIDSGEVQGTAYYVMPFVEGESLRERLTHEKQLPIGEAIRIATEVASALDYAHRHGVIHRDIKPENILLHDGQALVADFGIALAVSQAGGSRMTETGMSLGTPHYMSPEQAMGEREVTARSDVYGLGCVLYEMLTGDPPFTGSTAQAIVARVLTEQPRPITAQRHTVPEHVEAAVLTALEKLPADRFASAAEFAQALSDRTPTVRTSAPSGPAHRTPTAKRPTIRPSVLLLLGSAAAAFLLGAIIAGRWLGFRGKPQHLQADLLPPAGCDFMPVMFGVPQLSPDGTRLAFVARCGEKSVLAIRNLTTGTVEQLEGTAEAGFPFWSPDGASLGFFSGGALKRMDLASKAIRKLAPAVAGRGGTWSANGTIVFAPDIGGALQRVPAAGGTVEPATGGPRGKSREIIATHRNPYFLPDGEQFLFNEGVDSAYGVGSIRIGRLGSTESRPLLNVGSNIAYANGQLLYFREGVLVAQPFDLRRAILAGSARTLVSNLETYPLRFVGNFSVSGDRLVYRTEGSSSQRLSWFDPTTAREDVILPEGRFESVAVPRDGRQLLLARRANESEGLSLWIYDLTARSWARVADPTQNRYQFGWFPDGKRFYYSDVATSAPLRIIDRGTGSQVDSISRPPDADPLLSINPDGSFGLGHRQTQGTGFDLIRTPLKGGDRSSTVLIASPANEEAPAISPDGRLAAYISDRTGRLEVMATSLPDARVQWQISQDGTLGALAWAPDGRRLYFVGGDRRLMRVDVSTRDGVRFSAPVRVPGTPEGITDVAVAGDGRLVLAVMTDKGATPLTLMLGWQAALETR